MVPASFQFFLGLHFDSEHENGRSSSDMSANFYQSAQRHMPDYSSLHSLVLTSARFLLVICLAHTLTLKMEAIYCSKTSVNCWITRSHVPEGSTFTVTTVRNAVPISCLSDVLDNGHCTRFHHAQSNGPTKRSWSRSAVFKHFCSRTPRYNLSSTLHPRSCWCIIQIIQFIIYI
jgi:hypothetical protein